MRGFISYFTLELLYLLIVIDCISTRPLRGGCTDSRLNDILGMAISDSYGLPSGVEIVRENSYNGYKFRHFSKPLILPASRVFGKCSRFPNEFSVAVTLKISAVRNEQQYLLSVLAMDRQTIIFALKVANNRFVMNYLSSNGRQSVAFTEDRLLDGKWHSLVLSVTTNQASLTIDCDEVKKKKLKAAFPHKMKIGKAHVCVGSRGRRKGRFTGVINQLQLLSGSDIQKQKCHQKQEDYKNSWSHWKNNVGMFWRNSTSKVNIIERSKQESCSMKNKGELIYHSIDSSLGLCLGDRWKRMTKAQPQLNYLEEYASVRTKSKTLDIETFRIPDEGLFLATANQGRDKNMDSTIHKWNGHEFVSYQNITTDSAQDCEYFSIGDDHFLAVANQGADERKPTAISVIYRWHMSLKKFVPHQFFRTFAAQSWKYFQIKKQHFIVVANYGGSNALDGGRKDLSWVMLWEADHEAFVQYQSLDTTGGVDFEYFAIGEDYFLAVANSFDGNKSRLDSVIYKWNESKFIPFQYIETVGAHDFEFFQIDSNFYLAVANYYDYRRKTYELSSNIYKLNDIKTKFSKIQSLPTFGALDLEFFKVGEDSYIITGSSSDNNQMLNNVIYKWQGIEKFVPVHNILTRPCSDWELFQVDDGQQFLISANLKGKQNNILRLNTYI